MDPEAIITTPPNTATMASAVALSMVSRRKAQENNAARNGAVARIKRLLATEVFCNDPKKKIDPVPCSAIIASAAGVKSDRNPVQALR